MSEQIPFGYRANQFYGVCVYTIKLRFNDSNWSFISKELENSSLHKDVRTRKSRSNYNMLEFATTDFFEMEKLRNLIEKGYIAKLEKELEFRKRMLRE